MIFVYFLALFLGLVGTNIKSVQSDRIISTIMILLICLMGASMRNGYDTTNFISSFQTILDYRSDSFESISFAYSPFYYFIVIFFINIGVTNFFLFKFFVLLLCYLLIVKGIGKKASCCLVLFLYLLGPFFDDVMQLRNTISLALFIYATRYLYREGRRSTLLYVLFVTLATLNHFSFAFGYVLLFAKYNKERIIKICFFSGLFLYFYTLIFRNFFVVQYISTFLTDAKLSDIAATTTRFGSVAILLFYLANVFLVKRCNDRIQCVFSTQKSNEPYDSKIWNISRVSKVIYSVTQIMALFLFISVTALSYSRIIRDVIILFLIEYSLYYSLCRKAMIAPLSPKRKTESLLVVFGAMILMLFWMYFGNFVQGPPEDIIYSIFEGDIHWFSNK